MDGMRCWKKLCSNLGRPGLILLLALTVVSAAQGANAPVPPQEAVQERLLSFYNIHSGAHLAVIYRRGDHYVPETLAQINHMLCDPFCGAEHEIDPRVLDFLYDLLEKVDFHGEVHVVCGYRSVETNTMLHNRSSGVALGSMHLQGRALDFRLPGVDSKYVWETARAMKRGGTGYYKTSNFVHIDSGPVRWW